MEGKKFTHRTEEEKQYIKKRLNIVEGQIKGIKQMIDDDRYCDDVLTQLLAVNKSIEKGKPEVTDEIMGLFKKFR